MTLKVFGGVTSLLSLLVMITISLVILCSPDTFAWFANNEEVYSNGMQLKVDTLNITMTYYRKGPSDSEYEKINSFASIFSDLVPGDEVSVKIVYDSKEDEDYSASISLDSFDDCETPVVIDGKYYYLASQLKIVKTDEFLLEPPENLLSYDQPQTLSNLTVGTLTVAANSESEFEFTVRFENYLDVNQDAYQNFGVDNDGKCYRIITTTFD